MSKARKIIDDIRQNNGTEIDLVDKGIVNLMDAPGLCKYSKFWLVGLCTPATSQLVTQSTHNNAVSCQRGSAKKQCSTRTVCRQEDM